MSDRSKFDISPKRTASPMGATSAEVVCWTILGVALPVLLIAVIMYFTLSGSYSASESSKAAALGWVTFSQWAVGITLVPALLLTGGRQLAAGYVRGRDADLERAGEEQYEGAGGRGDRADVEGGTAPVDDDRG